MTQNLHDTDQANQNLHDNRSDSHDTEINPKIISEKTLQPASLEGNESDDHIESNIDINASDDQINDTQGSQDDDAHDAHDATKDAHIHSLNEQDENDLNEQIKVLQEKLLRQLAESENIRNRSAKLVDEARNYAIFEFSKGLVPVIDNLTMALDHAPQTVDNATQNLVEGVSMTKQALEAIFVKNGLEPIKPQLGDKFDYNLHHAISQVVTTQQAAGTVVSTMQIGYKIKERLIRPATVAVAKSNES